MLQFPGMYLYFENLFNPNMKKSIYLFIAGALVVASCAKKTEQPAAPVDSATVAGAPVETKAGNTDYKPAFEGQTRIASVSTTTPYEVTMLDSSFVRPWGIAALPDARFLVTEKGGTMRVVTATGKPGEP